METKHTPGPWMVETTSDPTVSDMAEYIVIAPDRSDIARICTGHLDNRDGGNARLVAAAPELLEASQAADAAFARIEAQGADGDAWHQAVEAWCMIRAAIAKAEGVQA